MSARHTNHSALRFRAGGVSGLPGDLACAAAFAHAFDVGDQRDLGHLAGWFHRHRRRGLQHSEHHSRFHCRRLLDHQRGGWIRDHRSHVADVQAKANAKKEE